MGKHLVAACAYDGLCTFEFGIVVELFGLPRPEFPDWYDFVVCAVDKGPLKATGGVCITPSKGLSTLRRADTIVVPGWRDHDAPPTRALRRRRAAPAPPPRKGSPHPGAPIPSWCPAGATTTSVRHRRSSMHSSPRTAEARVSSRSVRASSCSRPTACS